MLVITRREGEVVEVESPGQAEPGTIKVSKLNRERVRLAFDFDRDIRIVRQEVLHRRAKATA